MPTKQLENRVQLRCPLFLVAQKIYWYKKTRFPSGKCPGEWRKNDIQIFNILLPGHLTNVCFLPHIGKVPGLLTSVCVSDTTFHFADWNNAMLGSAQAST